MAPDTWIISEDLIPKMTFSFYSGIVVFYILIFFSFIIFLVAHGECFQDEPGNTECS